MLTPTRILTVIRLDDGVLFGGDGGRFTQLHPYGDGTISCAYNYGTRNIREAVRIGEDLLLIVFNNLRDNGQRVVWLLRDEPRPAPITCSR